MAEESKSGSKEVSESINDYLNFITCDVRERSECNNFADLVDFIGKPESSGGLGGRLENNIRFKKDHEKNNYGYSFLNRHIGLNENFVFKISRNIIDKVSNLKIADIGCGFGFNIIQITHLLNMMKPDSYDFKIEFELYDIFDNNIEALNLLKKIYQNDPDLNYITINVHKIDITNENIIEKKYDCDYVFILNVLHFINKNKWKSCLENIDNMLKVNGFIFIGVDAHLRVLSNTGLKPPERNFIISSFTISNKTTGINEGDIYPNLTFGLLTTGEDNLGEKIPFENLIERDIGSNIMSAEYSRKLGNFGGKTEAEMMQFMKTKTQNILNELKNGNKSLSLNGYCFLNSKIMQKAIQEKIDPEFLSRLSLESEVSESNDIGLCYQKNKIKDDKSEISGCNNYGCVNPGKLKCSRCKNASYCSKDCQVKSWGTHKLTCKPKHSDGKKNKLRKSRKRRSTKSRKRRSTKSRKRRS